MSGITGIGSGLDINSIVKSMVQAETAPKAAQLQRLEKKSEAQFTALGKLQGALSGFQTTVKDLNQMSLYEGVKATSSNTAALTASAEKNAMAGKYSVEVQHLAASSKVATAAISTDFKTSGAGTLEIGLGGDDDSPVTVNVADGASLTEVRDAINEQLKDKGISANIVNNPKTGESQLVLSAKETGEGKDIMVTGSGSLSAFTVDGRNEAQGTGAGYLQQARDAEFTVDGLKLTSATNTVKNVIPDVEFTLKGKTEENKPLTVTVGQDKAGVKDQLKKFVDAYNEFASVAKELTSVTPIAGEDKPITGGLVGDATTRNLVNAIRAEIGGLGGNDGIRMLADLGISMESGGKLKIDDKKLDAALENNFEAVGNFMAGENGLMSRLENRVGAFTGKDGIIGTRQKGIEATRADIKTQTAKMNERAAQIEARLLKQFNAMDALVGQLSSTSSSLMQSLASLPGIASN